MWEYGMNSATSLAISRPNVFQSKVTWALSWPEGLLTTTSVAFEYQGGQASAAVSVAQIFSTGALMTIALCANRSAWAGSKPSGQRISTERSMRSSWMVVMRHILVALAGCPTAAQ